MNFDERSPYILSELVLHPEGLRGSEVVENLVKRDVQLSKGGIYQDLGRLEEVGYVSSEQRPSPEEGGLPLTYYHITQLGRLKRIDMAKTLNEGMAKK